VPGAEPDFLRALLEPLRAGALSWLAAGGIGDAPARALVELFDVACLGGLAYCLVPLSAALRAFADPVAGRRSGERLLLAAAALAAVGLCSWDLTHPSSHVLYLIVRWDHVVFSALLGALLAHVSPGARAWTLALLSIAIVARYAGVEATAVLCAGILIAFAAAGEGRAVRSAVVLAALAAGVYALSWWLRGRSFLIALQTYSLFAVVLLRLVSVAVTANRNGRPPLGSYACYATFYLGSFGFLFAPEVYSDFARRNLGARRRCDARRAARGVALGALQIWLALRIPVSTADLFGAADPLAAWQASLLLFVRTALHAMGFWAVLEACALFQGFHLHANFRGLLSRRNPSELWWAWRGAFTNWLVRHVYGPLGADRRHQSLNILAAFAVSWFWHILGVPFLVQKFRLLDLAPLSGWALVNAAAVIAHVQVQRRGWHLLPARTPPALRRGVHVFLTCCLATTAVTFLSFQGDQIERFVPFLKLLVGLG